MNSLYSAPLRGITLCNLCVSFVELCETTTQRNSKQAKRIAKGGKACEIFKENENNFK